MVKIKANFALQIWIIYGDGSFGYSLAEIDTYTRHKTPVIALVGNDAGWTQITREQVTTFGSSIGCDLVVSVFFGLPAYMLGPGICFSMLIEQM